MFQKRKVRVAAAVLAVVVVLIGVSFGAAEYTSTSSFCDGCHEMNRYYDSWHASTHKGSQCKDCHIPRGFANFAKTKIFAFREVYVHVSGQVKAPLIVRRQASNSVCQDCHRDGGRAKAFGTVTLASSTFAHSSNHSGSCGKAGCHQRLVHQSVSPPTYVWPASMNACFVCHDDRTASKKCNYCHKSPPHNDMGQCDGCHSLTSWKLAGFNHPFPLEGVHSTLPCTKCHPAAAAGQGLPAPGGKVTFDFGKAPATCIDCHGDHHQGLKDCSQCHTAQGWTPANFTHPQVGPHIGSGGDERRTLQCGDCHDQGFGSASCSCHGGQRFLPGQPLPSGGD